VQAWCLNVSSQVSKKLTDFFDKELTPTR
jgi:hypothetical protein